MSTFLYCIYKHHPTTVNTSNISVELPVHSGRFVGKVTQRHGKFQWPQSNEGMHSHV